MRIYRKACIYMYKIFIYVYLKNRKYIHFSITSPTFFFYPSLFLHPIFIHVLVEP